MIHGDWTLIEVLRLFLFLPLQTGSYMILNSQSMGQSALPPEEPWYSCVQRLSCLFSLLIPESPCNPLPFAVREHHGRPSALDGHGTNQLLYFVRQALPACLLILLQSPDELGRKKQQGEKKRERSQRARGGGGGGRAARCQQLETGMCGTSTTNGNAGCQRCAVLQPGSWICGTAQCTLPAQHDRSHSGTSDATFLVSFSVDVTRFLSPNQKIAAALYHKRIHAIK